MVCCPRLFVLTSAHNTIYGRTITCQENSEKVKIFLDSLLTKATLWRMVKVWELENN